MSEEKRNRIIGAFSVTAVFLIFILAAVIVYQIIEIAVLAGKRNSDLATLNRIQSQIEEKQDDLDYYYLHQDEVMYILALKNGYRPAT